LVVLTVLHDRTVVAWQLLEQIHRENDPAKRDVLSAELWQILEEREQLRKPPSSSSAK
jgi:hypothetical protein